MTTEFQIWLARLNPAEQRIVELLRKCHEQLASSSDDALNNARKALE